MEQRIKAGLFNLTAVELAPIEKTIEIGRKLAAYRSRDHREAFEASSETERRVARRAVTEAITAWRVRLVRRSCDPKRACLARQRGRPNKRLKRIFGPVAALAGLVRSAFALEGQDLCTGWAGDSSKQRIVAERRSSCGRTVVRGRHGPSPPATTRSAPGGDWIAWSDSGIPGRRPLMRGLMASTRCRLFSSDSSS